VLVLVVLELMVLGLLDLSVLLVLVLNSLEMLELVVVLPPPLLLLALLALLDPLALDLVDPHHAGAVGSPSLSSTNPPNQCFCGCWKW